MARKVLSGLIQASNPINDESKSVAEIQAAMLEKHLPMIHEAGKNGVQILCLQSDSPCGMYPTSGSCARWPRDGRAASTVARRCCATRRASSSDSIHARARAWATPG